MVSNVHSVLHINEGSREINRLDISVQQLIKFSSKSLILIFDFIEGLVISLEKSRTLKNNQNNQRFKYDLHGYTLIKANQKVKEIILSCIQKNYKEILLITGKGIHSNTEEDIYSSKNFSKLRFSVPEYINSDEEISKYILSISKAEKKDGGEGAILIKIKIL